MADLLPGIQMGLLRDLTPLSPANVLLKVTEREWHKKIMSAVAVQRRRVVKREAPAVARAARKAQADLASQN
jgi:hypothetical protein